jgi:hypothetical protein
VHFSKKIIFERIKEDGNTGKPEGKELIVPFPQVGGGTELVSRGWQG